MFSLFMMYLSPYLIEPLFNKFEPIAEEGLEKEIKTDKDDGVVLDLVGKILNIKIFRCAD